MRLQERACLATGANDNLCVVENTARHARSCNLWVEEENTTHRFKLHNYRIESGLMNKFHINIAESDQPRTVLLINNGTVILRQSIAPAKRDLTYTINGEQVFYNICTRPPKKAGNLSSRCGGVQDSTRTITHAETKTPRTSGPDVRGVSCSDVRPVQQTGGIRKC